MISHDSAEEKTPESDFFFWLGMYTFGLSWFLPEVLEHLSFSKITENVHDLTLQFQILGNDSRYAKVFERLTPEVQAAIKFVISVDDKSAKDLTVGDVKKLIDAGSTIRNAANTTSLIK